MTKHLLAIFCLLPLAFGLGCEDSTNQNQPGNDADADTDADSDSDADSDAEFVIVAAIPFEGVNVLISDDSGAIVKEAAACEGLICTYQVPKTGRYTVEAEDTFTFISEVVEVDKPGEFQVSWITGGCASDPDWTPGSCDEWVPGEYAFPMLEGSYTDEEGGRKTTITIDVTAAIVIENVTGNSDASMSGYDFYGSTDVSWWAGTVIDEETFSMRQLSASSGDIMEFLFHRD